jgi:IS5 family transposase
MRHPYQAQPDLQITPIEKIRLPLKSRDELPPLLAGLQWIWSHPTLKAEIFGLLEAKVLAGKQATGRTGMDLWQILVLGVVRLGLDADWDRLEHVANYDSLVRQMLGVPATPWGEDAKIFGHQTLRDNVALLDDELLQQINAAIAAAGREVFAKKAGAPVAALEVKVDSYVLEADVHFPTDLNLLWDAGRKCVDLIEGYRAAGYALPGWRKAKDWRRQLKNLQRTASQVVSRGGPNKEARVKSVVREYLAVGRSLAVKVRSSLLELCDLSVAATRKCFPSSSRTPNGSRKASSARTWNWAISSCSRPISSN